MSYWDQEGKVDELKRLWAEGLSASVCAARLGGVTRNAVISKIDRLRDSGHDVGPKRDSGTSREARKASRPKPRPPVQKPVTQRSIIADVMAVDPTPLKETYMPPVEQMVVLQDLEEWHCRWPIGDPRNPEFRFCGGKHVLGLPYCEHHVRNAFAPPKPRFEPVAGVSRPVVEMEPSKIPAAGEAPDRETEEV